MIIVEWNPRDFIGFDITPHRPTRFKTLTGNETAAQAMRLGDYMEQVWPRMLGPPGSGHQILELIEEAVHERYRQRSAKGKINNTVVDVRNIDRKLYVKAKGELCDIAEIGHQLGWLGASIWSNPGVCKLSREASVSINGEDTPFKAPREVTPQAPRVATCTIKFTTRLMSDAEISESVPGNCWHALYSEFAMVSGYPTRRRPANAPGLDVQLDLAVKLVEALMLVDFGGLMCIKGPCTLLYPTRFEGNTISWHVLKKESGDRIEYSDDRICDSLRGRLHYTDIQNAQHIIGWCGNVGHVTGTLDAKMEVGISASNKPKRRWALEKVQISGDKYTTMGATFASMKNQTMPRQRDKLGYVGRPQWMERKYEVLYDSNDRIVWLVDRSSALFHLVLASLSSERNRQFGHLNLFDLKEYQESGTKSSEVYSGRQAAMNSPTNKSNLQLKVQPKFGQRNAKALDNDFHIFRDRVEGIFHILEQIIHHQEDNRPESVGMRVLQSRSEYLEGFDFRDQASRDIDLAIPKGT
ncbi:hypothetical protein F4808DRAFT_431435 [Astrocystis sublimbata]|nr:hypothetical protein F4808DRAFT_431435 [Astrocystis sublimbata]